MGKRLLLVAQAGTDHGALRRLLEEAGYQVMESSGVAAAAAAFEPELILLDHQVDVDTRLDLRRLLGTGGHPPIAPVVEMCLSRPEVYPTAARVLDRVSAPSRPRRRTESSPLPSRDGMAPSRRFSP